EQSERKGLQRPGCRGHLGQHIDAVRVRLDHPLQPAHLTFDAPQSLQVRVLAVRVPGRDHQLVGHASLLTCSPYTPVGYPTRQVGQAARNTGSVAEPADLPVVTMHVWDVTSARLPAALWHIAADRRRLPAGITFGKLVGTGSGRTFTPRDAAPLRWGLVA